MVFKNVSEKPHEPRDAIHVHTKASVRQCVAEHIVNPKKMAISSVLNPYLLTFTHFLEKKIVSNLSGMCNQLEQYSRLGNLLVNTEVMQVLQEYSEEYNFSTPPSSSVLDNMFI